MNNKTTKTTRRKWSLISLLATIIGLFLVVLVLPNATEAQMGPGCDGDETTPCVVYPIGTPDTTFTHPILGVPCTEDTFNIQTAILLGESNIHLSSTTPDGEPRPFEMGEDATAFGWIQIFDGLTIQGDTQLVIDPDTNRPTGEIQQGTTETIIQNGGGWFVDSPSTDKKFILEGLSYKNTIYFAIAVFQSPAGTEIRNNHVTEIQLNQSLTTTLGIIAWNVFRGIIGDVEIESNYVNLLEPKTTPDYFDSGPITVIGSRGNVTVRYNTALCQDDAFEVYGNRGYDNQILIEGNLAVSIDPQPQQGYGTTGIGVVRNQPSAIIANNDVSVQGGESEGLVWGSFNRENPGSVYGNNIILLEGDAESRSPGVPLIGIRVDNRSWSGTIAHGRIYDNTLSGIAAIGVEFRDGVDLDGPHHVRVEENDASGLLALTAQVSVGATSHDNTFKNNDWGAVKTTSAVAGFPLQGNDNREVTQAHVYLGPGAYNNIFKENTITGNAEFGIWCEGAHDNVFKENDLEDLEAAQAHVYLDSDTYNNLFVENEPEPEDMVIIDEGDNNQFLDDDDDDEDDDDAAAPALLAESAFGAGAPFPNPFNPEVWIPYKLSQSVEVSITIYNASGRLIRSLALGHQPAGFYTTRKKAAYWDGKDEAGEHAASGIYFYTIQAGDFTSTRKIVMLK